MHSILSFTLLIAFSVLAFTIGIKIMRLLKISGIRQSEYYIAAFALGTGFISLSMFIIGAGGYLTKQFIFPLFLGSLVYLLFSEHKVLFYHIHNSVTLLRRLKESYLVVLVSILILYAGWNLFVCLTPVINGDSLAAYLYVPKLYIEHGAIYPIKWLVWDDFPLGIHMLNTFGLVLDSGVQAQLISGWFMGVMNLLAVYALSRNFCAKRTAYLASLAFYAIPAISWLIFSTKIDLGFSFFELSFWALLFSWMRTKQSSLLFASAIVLGFAIGSKYHGLLALCFSLTVIGIVLLSRKYSIVKILKIVAIFGVVALISGSPSYIKNTIFVGDPLHPYLGNPGFGSEEQKNPYTGALDFARYQWNLFTGLELNGTKQDMVTKPIGIFPILLIPFALYSVRKMEKTQKFIAIVMLCYYIFISSIMFLSVWPYPRHLLPAIGLLFAFSAIGLDFLLSSKMQQGVKLLSIAFLIVAIVLYNGLPIGHRSIHRFKEQSRYLAGYISKETYLKRVLFDLKGSPHMNSEMINYVSTLPSGVRILTLDYANGYYVPRPLVKTKYIFSELNMEPLMEKLKDDEIEYLYYSETNLALVENQYQKHSILRMLCEESGVLTLEHKSSNQYLMKINY